MTDVENNHKYVHAGYQFMKMGKELMAIGEQLVEDARDKKAADKHVDDALKTISKLATAASRTRKNYHVTCFIIALIMEAFCVYGVATADTQIAAAAYGAGIPIWLLAAGINMDCLFGSDE